MYLLLKRCLLCCILGVFLSACAAERLSATPTQAVTHGIITSTSAARATASPHTLIPTNTPTPSKTLPPVRASHTPTPLPTIATFTPTYDARLIVTDTPAPMAKCPQEDPELMPWFPFCDENGACSGGPYYEEILSYFNMGGTFKNLDGKHGGRFVDLTGDGVAEFAFRDIYAVFVIGCESGQYETLLGVPPIQSGPTIELIDDLNNNGIPELLLSFYERYNFNSLRILEWDGKEFVSLIQIPVDHQDRQYTIDSIGRTGGYYRILDTNDDQLREIVVVADLPARPGILAYGLPWRKETLTFGWNGENYTIMAREYDAPQYRFQAIQDADRAALSEEYDKAISLYQDAIFSDGLAWWSRERQEYEIEITLYNALSRMGANMIAPTITPPPPKPTPIKDEAEYPRLAAYAYYRMALIYIVKDEVDNARNQLAIMQEKFTKNNPGYPYLELATAFFDSYQGTNNMTSACGEAIRYASEHPDILLPLGSDYHGAQGLEYKPEDVCPFR